jgi:hypothetical protein
MDLMNRSVQPTPANNEPERAPHSSSPKPSSGKIKKLKPNNWVTATSVALLFSISILLLALAIKIFITDSNRESGFIDKSKMQAVFLNNGQVYFGKITDLNSQYLNMAGIYYLRVNQQVQPGRQASQNDVSLVKLGCELHGPQDLMTINREQITFWENLKDDGQVAKAVAEYVKQNPNGQNCEQQAQQQQQQNNAGSDNSSTNDNNDAGNTDNTNTGNTGNTNNQTP